MTVYPANAASNLAGATKKVVWDLREARLQAISRNRSIKVTFLNDHAYAIWADNDKDGIVGTNEEKIIDTTITTESRRPRPESARTPAQVLSSLHR